MRWWDAGQHFGTVSTFAIMEGMKTRQMDLTTYLYKESCQMTGRCMYYYQAEERPVWNEGDASVIDYDIEVKPGRLCSD